MVDGVLLLVDASEGPLPQTRFVLRKALEARLPVILVVNKVDRPDARIAEVVDEVYELFLDLDADEEPDRVPDRLLQRPRRPRVARPGRRRRRTSAPLLDLLLEHIPAPDATTPSTRCRRTSPTSTPRRTSAAWRSAACATARSARGQPIAWCRADGDGRARAGRRALRHRGARPRRRPRRPGRARSSPSPGSPEVTIGETLADPEDPRPLPVITVDEPSLSRRHRHQHLAAGRPDGTKLTARQVQARLDAGAGRQRLAARARHRAPRRLGGPGPRRAAARGARRADAPRGLRAHRRPAAGAHARDRRQACTSRSSAWPIDVPEDYVGVVTQLLALRKGRLEQMVNHGTGWVRMEYLVPARGLIGFRTEFLTETRGTGLLHHVFDRWEPWAGELRTRPDGRARRRPPRARGAVRADEPPGARHAVRRPRRGGLRGHDRGRERARRRPRRQRRPARSTSPTCAPRTADVLVRLVPHRRLSLDQALEFLREDECVEVTPASGAPAQGRARRH